MLSSMTDSLPLIALYHIKLFIARNTLRGMIIFRIYFCDTAMLYSPLIFPEAGSIIRTKVSSYIPSPISYGVRTR